MNGRCWCIVLMYCTDVLMYCANCFLPLCFLGYGGSEGSAGGRVNFRFCDWPSDWLIICRQSWNWPFDWLIFCRQSWNWPFDWLISVDSLETDRLIGWFFCRQSCNWRYDWLLFEWCWFGRDVCNRRSCWSDCCRYVCVCLMLLLALSPCCTLVSGLPE
jgi:hypothetical protein